MNTKTNIITFIISTIIFVIGVILVKLNLGRLGTIGFAGYTLCTFSIIVAICWTAIMIATTGEKKSNEK
ncbi:MAG: hypothetical protein ACI4IN_00710 [Eubacterium sp.]